MAGVQAFCSCRPQNCSQLIQTIEDTGTIMREVRDLEEQVRLGVGGETKAGQWTAAWLTSREAVGPDTACGWTLSLAP